MPSYTATEYIHDLTFFENLAAAFVPQTMLLRTSDPALTKVPKKLISIQLSSKKKGFSEPIAMSVLVDAFQIIHRPFTCAGNYLHPDVAFLTPMAFHHSQCLRFMLMPRDFIF